MSALLPFFFAWVDPDQTTFTPHQEVVDEEIISFDLKHDEGQVATLDIMIRNPRVGLLSHGRDIWAWLSYQPPDGSGVVPLFFGVLVGIPSNLFAEKVSLQFLARPSDYIRQKQAVAETLKVRPYWDPVFLDEKRRDDPDAILEGWSALYHVDRTSLIVTASDILTGEDGTIVFEEDDALYDSVHLTIGQAPLTNIQIQATVNWTQRTTGFLPGPNVNIISYTGETFMSEWPKAGASLGGGWRVESAFCNDVYKVAQTPMSSSSTSWSDNSKDFEDCDAASMSESSTFPALLSPGAIVFKLTSESKSGICDPYSDPPENEPSSLSETGEVVPLWYLNATWNLRYDAKREFSEFIFFDVIANTQPVLAAPTVEQNTELLTISGSNVGEPLLEADSWSDFAGKFVALTQIIFPNNPTTPGGLSYQICVQEGTAGTVEPVFSDVPGTITSDNGVFWASLGQSPLSGQPNWSDSSFIALGEIIYYVPKVFNLAAGSFEDATQGTYLLCTTPGQTNRAFSEFTYVPPVVSNDEPTPTPVTVSVIPGPVGGGLAWIYPGSTASGGPGGTVRESGNGSVGWTNLGANPALLGIPIGGTPIDVRARSYFPSDRGKWSVEHLIARARARLRLRGRAVKVGWDCPIDMALGLSCRHNATLFDPRLPGGVATGKVTSYGISADGNTGKIRGHVEIGCAVGFGGTVAPVVGVPEYTADTGYMQRGYQQYDGSVTTITNNEIGYSPIQWVAFDDGLNFPLTDVPGQGNISGNAAEQKAAIIAAIPTTQELTLAAAALTHSSSSQSADGQSSVTVSGGGPSAAWLIEQLNFYQQSHAIPYVMESHPVSYEIIIKPVTNGPFNGAYGLTVTTLELPMGIDLEAASHV